MGSLNSRLAATFAFAFTTMVAVAFARISFALLVAFFKR
jgi:hypothetical protein